jgi:hypothetical protein
MTQFDMFNDAPLAGVEVRMPTPCVHCNSTTAEIEPGRGPHIAGLRCSHCRKHRGWMSREAYRFVEEVNSKFGRPLGPIVVRVRNPETASQGADAALTNPAPGAL